MPRQVPPNNLRQRSLGLTAARPCPVLAFTVVTSVPLSDPFGTTSLRKFELVTGCPDCPLVGPRSVELTLRLGVHVADEYAHRHADIVGGLSVVHARQGHHDRLRIGNAGKINCRSGRAAAACAAYRSGSCSDRRAGESDGARKGKDNLVVTDARRYAGAAFHSNGACERQIDVEWACRAMNFARNHAARDRWLNLNGAFFTTGPSGTRETALIDSSGRPAAIGPACNCIYDRASWLRKVGKGGAAVVGQGTKRGVGSGNVICHGAK